MLAGRMLGRDFERELSELYIKYRPIELDYEITEKEKLLAMEEWYQKCMDLYYKYNLTKDMLDKSIDNSNLIFRSGAKEFLKKYQEKNVPIIILSAGIGNVIERFLKNNDLYNANVYIISNFLRFDEKGNMKPFKEKIIQSVNKSIDNKYLKEINEKTKGRKYKSLVGDLIEDEKMVPKSEWDTTLKMAFLDIDMEKNLEKYRKNFDIVFTKGDSNFDNVDKYLFK